MTTGQVLTRIYDKPSHKNYNLAREMMCAMRMIGLDEYDAKFTVMFKFKTWDVLMDELLESPIHSPDEVKQLLMQRMLEIVWPKARAERFHFVESGEASR